MLSSIGISSSFALAGCSTLSRDGPATTSINGEAASVVAAAPGVPVFNYVLLEIDQIALSVFGTPPTTSLFSTFGRDKGPAPEIRVGVGDVVQLTIFESQAGGLFIPSEAGVRPGNFVTMPSEIIDRKGTITVPYAGDIRAVGKTVPELQKVIVDALSKRAIEPQVIVTIVSRASALASVVGAVNTPSKIEVSVGGERVLDMIAKANGISGPGYESYITLQRGSRKATVYFDTILANSRENIYVQPGDIIYVYREPHRFLAFGAVRSPGQIDFGAPELTLASAVARASGLDDIRAEPRDIFLYRASPRSLLERAHVPLQNFPPDQQVIPVIFRANFRDSASYFAAMNFKLMDNDVLYVSNSSAYELYKFLSLLNNISSTLANVSVAVSAPKNALRVY
jgi:polysaccharide biosynthesis/export protein